MTIATQNMSVGNEPKPVKRRLVGHWTPVSAVIAYWSAVVAVAQTETMYFYKFLFSMAGPAMLAIVICVGWWRRKEISRGARWSGIFFVALCVVLFGRLSHPSIGVWSVLFVGVPLTLTGYAIGQRIFSRLSLERHLRLNALLMALPFFALLTIRSEGLDGNLRGEWYWRWTQTAEQKFLEEIAVRRPTSNATEQDSALTLEATSSDSCGFRGTERDGVYRNVSVSSDWRTTPPQLKWKQKVGPAWSSLCVVGDHVFTQEQRGPDEVVVAYHADDGRELWAHRDHARYWEAVSGAGPRATPTFSDGSLYTVGATGIVNRLNASTGVKSWSVDMAQEAHAESPRWGTSTSPIVVNDIVIVYGGGAGHDNLIAYRAADGLRVWATEAGASTYTSPHLTRLLGISQIIIHHDCGLTSVDPETGKKLWTAGMAMPGAPQMMQPHIVSDDSLFVGSLAGPGMGMLRVSQTNGNWATTDLWTTSRVKPEFSECVWHDDHIYGFDGTRLFCLNGRNGKLLWKGGDYGRGQLILLADAGQLLVVSETGELALVVANPERHKELGRFQAINGKTWNHPVVSRGRIYLRNDEEMACYEF